MSSGNNPKYTLSPKAIFGFNTTVGNHVQYLDQTTVVYCAGNYIVIYDVDKKTQKLVPINPTTTKQSKPGEKIAPVDSSIAALKDSEVKAIQLSIEDDFTIRANPDEPQETAKDEETVNHSTRQLPANTAIDLTTNVVAAMTLSQNRQLLAIAFKPMAVSTLLQSEVLSGITRGTQEQPAEEPKQSTIVIFDTNTYRRKACLAVPDINGIDYLSFSPDGQYLATLTSYPSQKIFIWQWEKPKLTVGALVSDLLQNVFRKLSLDGLSKTTTAQTPHTRDKRDEQVVLQISFNPFPSGESLFCLSGCGVLKLFRFSPELPHPLRPFNSQQHRQFNYNFLCHQWIRPNEILLGTEESKLVIFRDGDILHESLHIHAGFDTLTLKQISVAGETTNHLTEEKPTVNISLPSGYAISQLVVAQEGFIVANRDGYVTRYDFVSQQVEAEKQNDLEKQYFTKIEEWQINNTTPSLKESSSNVTGFIHALSLSPSADSIVWTTSKRQMMYLNLGGPLGTASSEDRVQPRIDIVSHPCHSDTIVSMDICVRKPILATASADRTIRLWNIIDMTSGLTWSFQDDILSVALHPSGNYILVGLKQSAEIFTILFDKLTSTWSSKLKECRLASYSNGGQFYAIAAGSLVYIYHAYTHFLLCRLPAHSGRIRSMVWSKDDSKLITTGTNGSIYEWSSEPFFKRMSAEATETELTAKEVRQKEKKKDTVVTVPQHDNRVGLRTWAHYEDAFSFNSSTFGPKQSAEVIVTFQPNKLDPTSKTTENHVTQYDTIFTPLSNGYIQALASSPTLPSRQFFTHTIFTTLHYSPTHDAFLGSTLFGTSCLISSPDHSPLLPSSSSSSSKNVLYMTEYAGTRGPVTCSIMSPDGTCYIVGGEDGTLLVYKIGERQKLDESMGQSVKNRMRMYGKYADEVLVTRQYILDMEKELKEYKEKVAACEEDVRAVLAVKDEQQRRKMEEVESEMGEQVRMLQKEIDGYKTTMVCNKGAFEVKKQTLRDEFNKNVAELKATMEERLSYEVKQQDELKQNISKMETQMEQDEIEQKRKLQEELAKTNAHYTQLLQDKQAEEEHLRSLKADQFGALDVFQNDLDEEVDRECASIMLKYEVLLRKEREITEEIKVQSNAVNAEHQMLLTQLQNTRDEIKRYSAILQSMKMSVSTSEKEISMLKEEIVDREATIVEKDKRAFDLKTKNQELEKYRIVLEYKVAEMKREIEPKENERVSKESICDGMDRELETISSDIRDKMFSKGDLIRKLRALEQEISRERIRNQFVTSRLALVTRDLKRIQQAERDNPNGSIVRLTTDMFHRYCLNESESAFEDQANRVALDQIKSANSTSVNESLASIEEKAAQQANRRRHKLQHAMDILEQQSKQQTRLSIMQRKKVVNEHEWLISELTSLKREIHSSNERTDNFDKQIKETKRRLAMLKKAAKAKQDEKEHVEERMTQFFRKHPIFPFPQ